LRLFASDDERLDTDVAGHYNMGNAGGKSA
jgi:hypothetical protein